jgi:hypothetical protein
MNINYLDPGASIDLLRLLRTPSTTTLTRSATMNDDDCLGTDLAADLMREIFERVLRLVGSRLGGMADQDGKTHRWRKGRKSLPVASVRYAGT